MLRMKRATGTPMTLGEITLTPEAWVFATAGPRGGVVWSSPSAVLVRRDGHERRVPILDVTRLIQLLSLGMIVAVPLVRLWIGAIGRRKE